MPARTRCGQCDGLWPPGSRFCGHCGAPLGSATPPSDAVRARTRRARRRLFVILLGVVLVVLATVLLLSSGEPEVPPDLPPDELLFAQLLPSDGQGGDRFEPGSSG